MYLVRIFGLHHLMYQFFDCAIVVLLMRSPSAEQIPPKIAGYYYLITLHQGSRSRTFSQDLLRHFGLQG